MTRGEKGDIDESYYVADFMTRRTVDIKMQPFLPGLDEGSDVPPGMRRNRRGRLVSTRTSSPDDPPPIVPEYPRVIEILRRPGARPAVVTWGGEHGEFSPDSLRTLPPADVLNDPEGAKRLHRLAEEVLKIVGRPKNPF